MSAALNTQPLNRPQLRRWLPRQGDASVDFLWLLLGLTLVRGVIYALLNPPFGSPDEKPHLEYVANLATSGASGPRGAESYQPILYYALMVPAYWLAAGQPLAVQDLAVRLSSVPLLLGIVLFTWLAARRMSPSQPSIAAVAAAFVALQPQLAYISASASNDTAANFMATVLTYLLVSLVLLERSRRILAITAFAVAVGFLTKGTLLPTVALVLVVLTGAVASQRSLWQRKPQLLLLLGLTVLALVLVLSTRDGLILIGRAQNRLSALQYWPTWFTILGRDTETLLSYQFTSFWAAFLGESVHPHTLWYLGPAVIIALPMLGYLLFAIQQRAHLHSQPRSELLLRGMLVLVVIIQFCPSLFTFLVAAQDPNYAWKLQELQGRYLFPFLPALALLVSDGLRLWARETRTTKFSIVVPLITMAMFDIVCMSTLAGIYAWQHNSW